jgi:hypothetical protein
VNLKLSGMDFQLALERKLPPGVDELLGYTLVGTSAKLRIFRTSASSESSVGSDDGITLFKFKVQFSSPSSVATVTIYKTGTVQIASTCPHERALRFLDKYYFRGIAKYPVNVVKVDGRFYVDHEIDVVDFFNELAKKLNKGVAQLGLPPEGNRGFRAAIHLKWLQPSVSFIMLNNGTILFSGLKSESNSMTPVTVFKSLFTTYGVDMNKIFITGRLLKPKLPQVNKSAKKNYMASVRYVHANGYNSRRNGYYVRPGSDGKPHFYQLPENPALVRQKVLKAYVTAGVAIPQYVKNQLGITNAAPRNTVPKNNPTSFNAQKNGFHVRPGPSFKPQWYKTPKDKKAGKASVVRAYKRAGIPIPEHIRNLFSIGSSNNNVPRQRVINKNAQGIVRINGKHLKRYTVAALVKIAHEMGIAAASSKLSRDDLEYLILKAYEHPVKQKPNVQINDVTYTFMSDGKVRQNHAPDIYGKVKSSRMREFSTLPMEEQKAIARAYLSAQNFASWNDTGRGDRYNALLAVKNLRARGLSNSQKSSQNLSQGYLNSLVDMFKQP